MKLAMVLIAISIIGSSLPASAADPSSFRLAGVRIAVSDFDRSIAFYSRLGMTAGDRYNAREQQLKWNDGSHGSDIILYRDDGAGRIKLTPGTASLAFWVPDMQATIRSLKAAGYTDISEPRDMKLFLIALARDPDGNSIELAQPLATKAPK
jgi:catechol 2,3-dioxygenase-like lactoylglutathione lyase family enzyme